MQRRPLPTPPRLLSHTATLPPKTRGSIQCLAGAVRRGSGLELSVRWIKNCTLTLFLGIKVKTMGTCFGFSSELKRLFRLDPERLQDTQYQQSGCLYLNFQDRSGPNRLSCETRAKLSDTVSSLSLNSSFPRQPSSSRPSMSSSGTGPREQADSVKQTFGLSTHAPARSRLLLN